MYKRILVSFAAVLAVCSFVLLPVIASANSAEPPAILVVVNNAPNDLALEAELNGEFVPMQKSTVGWESYYKLHYFDYPSAAEHGDAPTALRVTQSGDVRRISFPAELSYYNNVFTLDLSNMTLREGTLPLRSVLLVALRVVLTLALEGAVFYLFRFREKRSWAAFFIINLITQGLLNVAINGGSISGGYMLLSLILLEILIVIVEIPAFLIAVNEGKWWKRLLYVLSANLLSLILGGILITYLPV